MSIEERDKQRLMLLLEMRGKCAELEHKLSMFEANALKQIRSHNGSLFVSMNASLKSMEKSIEKWMDEFIDLTVEWRGFSG